jgi:hypothetical protein
MPLLSENQIRLVSARCSKSPTQLLRILGSIRVPLADDKNTELGLRLWKHEPQLPPGSSQLIEPLLEALGGYESSCPLVFAWLCRAGFKEKAPRPAHITKALVLHAARTAGRLRAKFLRETKLVSDLI